MTQKRAKESKLVAPLLILFSSFWTARTSIRLLAPP